MARQARVKSALGIYHVMLRGINKQDIFFNDDDFLRMMTILKEAPVKKNEYTNEILSYSQCTIYAYCILHNHLHILIREGDLSLSDIMKRIEDRYALYYNKKYERIGHLFQSRFPSEPVNDAEYFHTVFRYIALNPVKAKESRVAEEYPYSSWNEYVGHKSNVMKVIKPSAISAVIKRFPLYDLQEWINEDNQDKCLDMDTFSMIKSDKEAWEILSDSCGIENPEDFRILDQQTQIFYLLDAIDHGINISQASRLGTVSRYQLTLAVSKKLWRYSAKGTDPDAEKLWRYSAKGSSIGSLPILVSPLSGNGNPVVEENVEMVDVLSSVQQKIRCIIGMRKKTYEMFHRIAEYLYENPHSKCQDIAAYLGVSNENSRKFLVQLSNENIVVVEGSARSTTYSLKLWR